MGKKKKKKVRVYKPYRETPPNPTKDWVGIVTTIAIMPLIIASAIAMMAISYMLVPLALVGILGTIVYIYIKIMRKNS